MYKNMQITDKIQSNINESIYIKLVLITGLKKIFLQGEFYYSKPKKKKKTTINNRNICL